jgi:hypothetical protein
VKAKKGRRLKKRFLKEQMCKLKKSVSEEVFSFAFCKHHSKEEEKKNEVR